MYNGINDKRILKTLKSILASKKLRNNLSLAMGLTMVLNGSCKNIEEKEKIIDLPSKSITKIDDDYNTNLELQVEEEIQIAEEVVEVEVVEEVDKFKAIMEKEGLTAWQLDTVIAGCCAESCDGGNNYLEAYSVASVVHNRTKSKRWVNFVESIMGSDTGENLYYQFTCPGQFSVYKTGAYKKYLGRTDLAGYQAVIDMLYTEETSNNNLSFRANWVDVQRKYEMYNRNGNKYFDVLTDEDRIVEDNTLVRTK